MELLLLFSSIKLVNDIPTFSANMCERILLILSTLFLEI